MRYPANPYKKTVIYNGNSLFCRGNGNIENVLEAPYASYNALSNPKPPMMCYAFSGKSISELTTDFTTKIQPYIKRGDIVVFNENVNTLADNHTVSSVQTGLLAYRTLVRSFGAKIIVSTMTCRAENYVGMETDRQTLNAWILANTSQFDGVADPGGITEFNSLAGVTNTTYYSTDQSHFTTAGYTLYGQSFNAAINSLL
jgi:hypothetical protein